jgi:DNA-binding response OmpR family regulator
MVNILLIEPDAVLAKTYAAALEQAAHAVMIAFTAQAAIDISDDNAPDVVLLELQLVAHSGIEFLYEFRSYPEWRSIPVIIVSHVPPAEFRQNISALQDRLGIREYYYKPHMNLQKLLQIVEAAAVRA